MGYKHYTEDQLVDFIFQALLQSPEPLTRLEIAQFVGRKKTPRLLEVIQKLVDTGLIVQSVGTTPKGLAAYVYSVADDAYERLKESLEDEGTV